MIESSICSEAGEICCEFKRCCTAFFMELVSVYSFSEAARLPPAPELVHMLMELVVQRRLPGVEGLHTRPFSPFEEDTIDSRPVVRSFLLQLLLKYRYGLGVVRFCIRCACPWFYVSVLIRHFSMWKESSWRHKRFYTVPVRQRWMT